MHSLRRWFYRPKKEDGSKLALFYWADEELTTVAAELDSFDGRTDPDRCSILVGQLRICQDKVLSVCNDIMEEAIPDMRANRDFRAKFPDDVLHENLAGQLWFGAECLAAGSNIIHRELESAGMRPLAKALTRALENVRCLLREQSLRNSLIYSDKVREALRIFDRLFADFELSYVSAMVPVKSAKEYHLQQDIIVLFSESLIRALKIGLVTQDMIDNYDPSLMFTIPRLAIIWGLLLYPDGPFNVKSDSQDLSELFRPFCNLLFKIRELLWTLTESELHALEKMLCSLDEPKLDEKSKLEDEISLKTSQGTVAHFYRNQVYCKQFIHDFYSYNFGIIIPENLSLENPDDTLLQEKHSMASKKLANILKDSDLEVEFNQTCGKRKSSVISESDIETLAVGSDYEPYCQEQSCDRLEFCASNTPNKDLSEECLPKGNVDPSLFMDHSLQRVSEGCTCCPPGVINSSEQTCLLGEALKQLHGDCTCGLQSSREHLTPSREIMRKVMHRVEIVPPGQRISGYGSSVEGSPRAYHHGLLSHSFPNHSQSNQRIEFPARCKTRRQSRRDSIREKLHPSSGMLSVSCDPSSEPLLIPRAREKHVVEPSCSSCQSISSVSSADWASTSPDTSSYNSDCHDDEEVALALQANEIATRNKARSRFKSSRDLLHKLFVCVSGVADQLQTNYASDLRNILKCVFEMNQAEESFVEKTAKSDPNCNEEVPFFEAHLQQSDEGDGSSVDSAEEVLPDNFHEALVQDSENNQVLITEAPPWMPDELCSNCLACKSQFTILRRRHHCRNCGKIFCSRCSSNSIPLPKFGHFKPVRVCNQCFMYELTNLVMQRQF